MRIGTWPAPASEKDEQVLFRRSVLADMGLELAYFSGLSHILERRTGGAGAILKGRLGDAASPDDPELDATHDLSRNGSQRRGHGKHS